MAKFHGKVGYNLGTLEVRPGVWEESVQERLYRGDIVRSSRQLREGDKVISDISVNHTISIVADPFANLHFFAIRYVEWAGALWTVEDVDVQRPRLLLRLGGVYHGPTP